MLSEYHAEAIAASALADTLHPETGERRITLALRYPRTIHAQFLMHRVFARNSQSSRAIPISKMAARAPWIPRGLGKNQKGMVPGEALPEEIQEKARAILYGLWEKALAATKELEALGVHKQWANRYLEPWSLIDTAATGRFSDWMDFLALREAEDAQEEIRELARAIRGAIEASKAKEARWHVPFLAEGEEAESWDARVSACARCARVSYGFGGKASPAADLSLAFRLLKNRHMSPFEHCAKACEEGRGFFGSGWVPLRHLPLAEGGIAGWEEKEARHAP